MTRGIEKRYDHFDGATPGEGPLSIALIIGSEDMDALVPADQIETLACHPIRARNVAEAHEACAIHDVDLVVMPLSVNNTSLLPILNHCTTKDDPPAIVVIAQSDQINDAAEAMRSGADECLFSPFSPGRLDRTLRAALAPRDHHTAHSEHRRQPGAPDLGGAVIVPVDGDDARPAQSATPNIPRFHGMVGQTPAMVALFDRVQAISGSDAPVLLQGEVGSGKRRLARAIHAASPRADHPFVTVNCATLSPDGFETVFNGTGEIPDVVTRARGGTLFLNHLNALPDPLQCRLVALLQEEEARRRPDTARVIGALSEPVARFLSRGSLAENLYFTLNVVELALPPLRDRRADIPDLIEAILADQSKREGCVPPVLSATARDLLISHDWPGNLRELTNVMRGLVLIGSGAQLGPDDLPASVMAARSPAHPDQATGMGGDVATTGTPAPISVPGLVGQRLADIERAVIEATIAAEGGSVTRAARVLDVSPSTIYRKRDSWTRDDPS